MTLNIRTKFQLVIFGFHSKFDQGCLGKLVFTMILWGISWPVVGLLVIRSPPVSIAVIRYAIVVPRFLAILWVREHSFKISREWIFTFVILGIFGVTLYQSFSPYGGPKRGTSLSWVSVISQLVPSCS